MLHVKSPAKINLFLKVLKKRTDGYHDLVSIFQTIDLFDFLSIQISDKDLFVCNDPDLCCDRSNLIWKAVDLFNEKNNSNLKFAITLKKNIPKEAGLGGGSSNAASTLWGINELTGNKFSLQQLQEWSIAIGSDVPFFFSSGTAFCTGKGERVESFSLTESSEEAWIAKPNFGLSTKEIFQNVHLDTQNPFVPSFYLKQFLNKTMHDLNDLENVALKLKPELLDFKEQLLSLGFDKVWMTGSGSAFVCKGNPSQTIPSFLTKVNYITKAKKWY